MKLFQFSTGVLARIVYLPRVNPCQNQPGKKFCNKLSAPFEIVVNDESNRNRGHFLNIGF